VTVFTSIIYKPSCGILYSLNKNAILQVLLICVFIVKEGSSHTPVVLHRLQRFLTSKSEKHHHFLRVGVDFGGPLYVKRKSGEMDKAYIALLSCCVTRAVYLDLVEDLSTATVRRYLRRCIA